MKRLLLGAAVLSAVACASEPSAVVTRRHEVESDPSPLHPLAATDEALASTTTTATVAPTTTTTEAPKVARPASTRTVPNNPATTRYVAPTTAVPAPVASSGRCGGSLPPCWVMNAESGGSLTAVNATGCGGRGCFGKWQFDPITSRGLGYPLTMDQYPESVQDDAARTLWAGGSGCSHWGAC